MKKHTLSTLLLAGSIIVLASACQSKKTESVQPMPGHEVYESTPCREEECEEDTEAKTEGLEMEQPAETNATAQESTVPSQTEETAKGTSATPVEIISSVDAIESETIVDSAIDATVSAEAPVEAE